ncbi:hypothetical protein [Kluyvera huaxiensis]|uniref:hypothetical protein n=1 Tax=Kluyvera sp. 142053 TaxID=3160979 RepID=UPI0032DF6FD7
MTATNQQMTSEQLADLSTLAVQLQAKAEANNDRDTAVMAYAVQKACAELIESRREFTAANATIHNLKLKVAQVVAENAGLKSAIDATVGWQQSTDSENVESVRMLADIQTPATDAYLDEMRAQGVERMIEVKQKQLDGMHPDTFAIGAVRDSIRRDIYELKVFAEILRQESQLRQGAEQ